MVDIAQELLKKVQERFSRYQATDKELAPLIWAVRHGNADYETANKCAIRLGELLARAIKWEISSDKLPDGKMTEEIAKALLEPLFWEGYELTSSIAYETQAMLNKKAGFGIKPIMPPVNKSRVNGLVEKVSSYQKYEDAAWVLDEPVVNLMQSVVDDSIRENVEAHAAAGLHPIVQRICADGCCDWCRQMAGIYAYPVERDVYRRHERCRCLVVYDSGDGKIQNVHTKVLYAGAARRARDERIGKVLAAEKKLR